MSLPTCRELPVLVIGTTDRPSDIPAKTLSLFIHRIEIDAPTLEERRGMIEALGQGANVARGEGRGEGGEAGGGGERKEEGEGVEPMYGGVSGRLGWKQVYISKLTDRRKGGTKGLCHMHDDSVPHSVLRCGL